MHSLDTPVTDYIATGREAASLSGPWFARVFQLDRESVLLRAAYGGEFGQRCLPARRLVEAGVWFIEASHNLNSFNGTGWSTHNHDQIHQHELMIELDHALSALLDDLERVGRLDRTLVVVAAEFGRPAAFDRGGRGHQSTTFGGVLAGGGLRTGQVIGQTGDLSKAIFEQPVSVPDSHSTIYASLGINPTKDPRTAGRPGADHRSRQADRLLVLPGRRAALKAWSLRLRTSPRGESYSP